MRVALLFLELSSAFSFPLQSTNRMSMALWQQCDFPSDRLIISNILRISPPPGVCVCVCTCTHICTDAQPCFCMCGGVHICIGMNACGHAYMWKPVIDVGNILSSYLTLDIEVESLDQTKNSLIWLVFLASLFLGFVSPFSEIGITSRSTCQLDICMWTSQDLKACNASMITTDSSH